MIAHAFQIATPIICTHYTEISMSVLIVFILSVVALYMIWYLPLYFLRKKGILSLLGWIVLGGYSTQVLFVLLQCNFKLACIVCLHVNKDSMLQLFYRCNLFFVQRTTPD